jgi:hypothetical protein
VLTKASMKAIQPDELELGRASGIRRAVTPIAARQTQLSSFHERPLSGFMAYPRWQRTDTYRVRHQSQPSASL